MNEMGLWDYITISATLLIVGAYIVMRVRKVLDPNSSGGCGCGKSKSECSTEVKKNCSSTSYVSVSKLSESHSKQS